MFKWIGIILSVIIVLSLLICGADSNIMQAVGNFFQNAPLVGPMLNALGAFTRADIERSVIDAFLHVLLVAINILSGNIIDAIFMGFFFYVVDFLLHLTGIRGRIRTTWLVVTTIVGILILTAFNQMTAGWHAAFSSVGSLAFLLLGIGLILRGSSIIENIFHLVVNVLIGVLETGAGISVISSILIFPSMIRQFGVSSMIPWFIAVVLISVMSGAIAFVVFELHDSKWA